MDENKIDTVDVEVIETEEQVVEETTSLGETLFKGAAIAAAVVATGGLAVLGYKLHQKKTNPELYYAKKAERLEKKMDKACEKYEAAYAKYDQYKTTEETVEEEVCYEEVEEVVSEN